jgi:ABC-type multidrug transport system ATPase subunit
MLACKNLRKHKKRPLANPISFTLGSGEGLAVYGFNGSGKTTLLDIIAGLIAPDEGDVWHSGSIGYCMQNPGFQESLSVKENLQIEAALCGLPRRPAQARVKWLGEAWGLTEFWDKRLSKCSAGMQQKLSLAAAFMSSPKILLLDEAFNALDDLSRENARKMLVQEKERGAGIILVSHLKEDFPGLCERMLALPGGEMVSI